MFLMSPPHFECWNIYSSEFINELLFHSRRTKGKTPISPTPQATHHYFHYTGWYPEAPPCWLSRVQSGRAERGMARISSLLPRPRESTGAKRAAVPRAGPGHHSLPDGSEGAARDPPCSPGRASTGTAPAAPSTWNSFCKVKQFL